MYSIDEIGCRGYRDDCIISDMCSIPPMSGRETTKTRSQSSSIVVSCISQDMAGPVCRINKPKMVNAPEGLNQVF